MRALWLTHPHLFHPRDIAPYTADGIGQMLLAGHVARYYRQEGRAWAETMGTLRGEWGGRWSTLLEDCDLDALRVASLVRQGGYPRLAGDKVLPFWLRVVRDVAGWPLTNVERLPLPVDIHVAQSTLSLGIVATEGEVVTLSDSLKRAVRAVWAEAVPDPMALDPALWTLSKLFLRAGKPCPLGLATVPVRVVQS